MYEYDATIERVIDGDTFVALVDQGFHTFRRETFRVAGIDCPELSTLEGRAAKAFVIEWLDPVHARVRLKSDKPDKYGRWLATVWRNTEEPSLAAVLISRNMAVPYDGGKRPPF